MAARMRLSYEQGQMCNWALVVVLALTGLLSSNPTVWYKCQIKAFFYLVFGGMATAYAFQLFARSVGTLIQTSSKAQPTHWMDEIKHTVVGFGMTVASISAWPMMMYELGMETAIRWDLNECGVFGSPALYILKALVGLLAADFYNYWKHRFFHSELLWVFHKTHHHHHNPSAMAGFAISPVFGFATFVPVYAFCFPVVGLYMPLHWPFIAFYMLLNYYLHCGYTIEILERVLSPLYIMTSGWHNVHHEKGRMGFNYKAQTFGEMLSLWDVLMGTHASDHYLYSGDKPKENGVKAKST